LDTLKRQIQTKKTKLEELQRKGKLSEVVQKWLDHEGNIVDEQLLLDKLDGASDYERAIERLDDTEKVLVRKLRALAGDSNERKDNCLINGDDGEVLDDGIADKPRPTRREVLQAVSVLNRYLDLEDGPLARELQRLLQLFVRDLRLQESRSLMSTCITD